MDNSKKAEEVKKSPQRVLEDAIKKSSGSGEVNRQDNSEKTEKGGSSGEAKNVTGNAAPEDVADSAVHGYDEVKATRPANLDGGSSSSPTGGAPTGGATKYGTSDYLVPRLYSNYEPVSSLTLEDSKRLSSSYEIPKPSSLAVQPSSSGYMALQSRPKSPEHYVSKEPGVKANISRSASKELISGLPRNVSKEHVGSLPHKGSRELVKTPSISEGLNEVDERSHSTSTYWSSWLSIAAIIIGVISLVLGIASLGVSTNQASTGSTDTNRNLMAQVDSIKSQLQQLELSRRPNCSMSVQDSCALENTNSNSSGKFACTTRPFVQSELSTSSFGCVVDVRDSEFTAEQLDLFTAVLFWDLDGYRCRCFHSNSTVVVDVGVFEVVSCAMIVTYC